jgi:hypothetical protein
VTGTADVTVRVIPHECHHQQLLSALAANLARCGSDIVANTFTRVVLSTCLQDIAQYEAATYAQHMITAVAAAQQLGQGDDLRAACDVKQPDYDKRGDMVVRYTDNRSFQAIAGQLAPMLGDLKVGQRVWSG